MKAGELVERFQYALDNRWGYIYNMTHEMWTAARQQAYSKQYANNPDCANSIRYGEKWVGHWVTDCSGLFKWAFQQYGEKIAHGSNSIWDKYCTEKGTLHKGKRSDGKELRPGTAVFTTSGDRHNHIGLYAGNGIVIEAQGCEAGVTTTKITNRKWTAWGELRGVQYEGGVPKEMGQQATVVLPSGATGNTVNMRIGNSQASAVLERVPVGATVTVILDMGTWCAIEYNGKSGYMMSNYLEYQGQGGESGQDGDVISFEEREKIEAALKTMEAQIEVIRTTLGRG